MYTKFCFLVLLLRSIRALNVSDTFQPGSFSSNGGANFSDLASDLQLVINDCPYNNTSPSSLAYDSSSCVNLARKNSGGTQFPNLDEFAKNFTDTILSIPSLQRFIQMDIPVSELKVIFYKLDYKYFKAIGHPIPEFFANAVSETIGFYDVFPLTEYFKIVGNLIPTFLQDENMDLGYSIIQCYAYLLENTIESTCVVSGESLYKAFLNALVNSVKSLGFNLREVTDLIFQIFIADLLMFLKDES